MNRNKLNLRSLASEIIALCLLLTSLFFPFIEAFYTSNPYGSFKGSIVVWKAFHFIFGGTVSAEVTIGVGHATTVSRISPISVEPSLYALIGYCLLLCGFMSVVFLFVFEGFRKRGVCIFFDALTFSLLISGGVLLLLSGPQVAASFFNVPLEETSSLMNESGFRLGNGFLWTGICGFGSAFFAFMGGFSHILGD